MAEKIGYNDMMRMQSEAVQRVREMQRRAQNAVQKANAQRTGRAQEQTENKGESFKPDAPPINRQSARATALPLDYISNQSHTATAAPFPHNTPSEEKSTQSAEKKEPESTANSLLSENLDRLLVVVLILLLSQEEADELLLMALGYLII